MGRLVEGVWDCPYCGTDRIRGLLHKCPHCGRQRDNTIKFYLADPMSNCKIKNPYKWKGRNIA